jgi:hypothetical protein
MTNGASRPRGVGVDIAVLAVILIARVWLGARLYPRPAQ